MTTPDTKPRRPGSAPDSFVAVMGNRLAPVDAAPAPPPAGPVDLALGPHWRATVEPSPAPFADTRITLRGDRSRQPLIIELRASEARGLAAALTRRGA
jgi:hypothetical protein